MGPTPNVYLFSPKDDPQLVPYLAALHAQCINHDHTIATFLPPLSHEKLLAWWKERLAEVNAGTRLIFILLNEETPQAKFKGTELVGVVMLSMPQSETGSMRGIVEKLLINPKYRRRGGARQLIGALEAEALQRGKTVLVSEQRQRQLRDVISLAGPDTERAALRAYSHTLSGSA